MENAPPPPPKLPTPIKAHLLAPLLRYYIDEKYILNGLEYGFDLGYVGPQSSQRCNNNKSVNDNTDIALQKITHEVQLNRIAGPFDSPPSVSLNAPPWL